MKKVLIAAAALAAALSSIARADTSYLLIQGGGETFKWKVNYAHGDLTNGLDLFQAVFGTATATGGTYTDGFFSEWPYWSSSLGENAAGYLDFGGGSLFLESVTLDTLNLAMDPDYDPLWIYQVSGGTGLVDQDNLPDGAYSDDGTWQVSNDGMLTRGLEDGSFDAWLLGSWGDPILGDFNLPLADDFSDAMVINFIPEPGSVALFLLAAPGLWALARRRAGASRVA